MKRYQQGSKEIHRLEKNQDVLRVPSTLQTL